MEQQPTNQPTKTIAAKRTNDCELIKERNQKIYQRYCELWGDGMRDELIWPILSKEFWLRKQTLYRIFLKITKVAKAA